jgi:polyhydroxyalkanoate synthesis regulator phasin
MYETELREARQKVGAVCSVLDPASVPLPEAPKLWQELEAMKRKLAGAQLRLATFVDESGVWIREGFPSPAHWLAKKAGTSVGKARQQLKTSEKLQKLRDTDDAVQNGDLSTDQANEVADAASENPDAEQDLLNSAKKESRWDLKERCGKAKAAAQPDDKARERRIHEQRRLSTYKDGEGAWNLHLRHLPAEGAKVEAALEPYIQRRFDEARRRGEHEPREAYAADAFMDLLRDKVAGGEPPKGGRRTESKVIATVDLSALLRGFAEPGETCEIKGVGTVPVSVARALLTDAVFALVVRDGVDILNVTHLGRQVTAHMRTALEARGYECGMEDCDVTWGLEIDHLGDGWSPTKVTRLDQLDWKCRHCHGLKTYRGWEDEGPTGKRRWVRKPGTTTTGERPPPPSSPPSPPGDDTLFGENPAA